MIPHRVEIYFNLSFRNTKVSKSKRMISCKWQHQKWNFSNSITMLVKVSKYLNIYLQRKTRHFQYFFQIGLQYWINNISLSYPKNPYYHVNCRIQYNSSNHFHIYNYLIFIYIYYSKRKRKRFYIFFTHILSHLNVSSFEHLWTIFSSSWSFNHTGQSTKFPQRPLVHDLSVALSPLPSFSGMGR